MDKLELKKRCNSLEAWLKFNMHSDFYHGVLNYKNRLLTLLYSKS